MNFVVRIYYKIVNYINIQENIKYIFKKLYFVTINIL